MREETMSSRNTEYLYLWAGLIGSDSQDGLIWTTGCRLTFLIDATQLVSGSSLRTTMIGKAKKEEGN